MQRRIVRVNPWREMLAMQNALGRMIEDSWNSVSSENDYDYTLPIDLIETDNGYTLTAELPGIDESSIDIRLDDSDLIIEATVPEQALAEDVRVLVHERRYGKFSRRVRLPQPIDSDKVEAFVENGLLTLMLPKVPEIQPRTIKVQKK